MPSTIGNSLYQCEFCPTRPPARPSIRPPTTSPPTKHPTRPPTNTWAPEETEDTVPDW